MQGECIFGVRRTFPVYDFSQHSINGSPFTQIKVTFLLCPGGYLHHTVLFTTLSCSGDLSFNSWVVFIPYTWWLITAQVSLPKLWLGSLIPNLPPALKQVHEAQHLNSNLTLLMFFPLFLSSLPSSNWFLDFYASLPGILNSLWNKEWTQKPTTNIPLPESSLDDSRGTLVQVDCPMSHVLFVSSIHDNFWMSCQMWAKWDELLRVWRWPCPWPVNQL